MTVTQMSLLTDPRPVTLRQRQHDRRRLHAFCDHLHLAHHIIDVTSATKLDTNRQIATLFGATGSHQISQTRHANKRGALSTKRLTQPSHLRQATRDQAARDTDSARPRWGGCQRISLTPFLPATVLRGPFRVRAFVRVRWPRTGSPLRWRSPR